MKCQVELTEEQVVFLMALIEGGSKDRWDKAIDILYPDCSSFNYGDTLKKYIRKENWLNKDKIFTALHDSLQVGYKNFEELVRDVLGDREPDSIQVLGYEVKKHDSEYVKIGCRNWSKKELKDVYTLLAAPNPIKYFEDTQGINWGPKDLEKVLDFMDWL